MRMIHPSDRVLLGVEPRAAALDSNLPPLGRTTPPSREEGEMPAPSAARARRTLRFGVACSLHWGAGRNLIASLRQTHPEVDLVVEDIDEIRLREELDGRQIDVAIAPTRAARPDWLQTPLWSERLIAVLPERHALAADNAVPQHALRAEIILLAGEGDGDQALQAAISDALGGAPAGFMHHPVERGTLFDLVALGMGVSVSPSASLGAYYPGISLRPILSETAEIDYSLMWRADTCNEVLADLLRLAH